MHSGFRSTDTSARLGAIVEDLDVRAAHPDDFMADLRELLSRRGVVVLRGQSLKPAEQVAFSERFGELEINVFRQYTRSSEPKVFVVSNILENGNPIGLRDGGGVWHSDMSYAARPASYSFLYADMVPMRAGRPLGDTWFSTTADAYDDLDDAMKRELDSLRAVHRLAARYDGLKRATGRSGEVDPEHQSLPDSIHPLVRVHPESGRRCLYINPGLMVGIVGMSDQESRTLIDQLLLHCTQDTYVYRHSWRKGDLVIWDNRATLHRATTDYTADEHRLMHRTTAIGEVPIPVPGLECVSTGSFAASDR